MEKTALALVQELGWSTLNAYHEVYSEDGTGIPSGAVYLGRATRGEALLRPRLISGELDVSEMSVVMPVEDS